MNNEPSSALRNAPAAPMGARAEVYILVEGTRVATYLLDPGTYMIGRIPSCGIRLDDRSISREHAVLTFRAEGWTLEDLNSRNGTYVDGQLVRGTVRIKPEQKLRVGISVLEIHLLAVGAASAAQPALRRAAVLEPTDEAAKHRNDASATLVTNSAPGKMGSKSQQMILAISVSVITAVIFTIWLVGKKTAAPPPPPNSGVATDPLKKADRAFYTSAVAQLNEAKFSDALESINNAIALAPNEAEYHYLLGNVLENFATPPQVDKAIIAYTKALELNRTHKLAKENFDLCIKLISTNKGRPDLTPKSKRELQEAMRAQGRTAEAMALYKRLGTHPKDLLQNGQLLLDQAGVKGKLVLDNDKLNLDLSNIFVEDLGPIKSLPLDTLNLENAPVPDVAPLKGMPLRNLNLKGTKATDLSPLASCLFLENLTLPAKDQCQNLAALRKLPHLQRIGFANNADNLPDQTAAEFWADNDKK